MADPKREMNEALWLAARDGDLATVKEKHEAGADVNWRHPWEPPGRLGQFAALHIASDQGHMDVAKYLVDKAHADLCVRQSRAARFFFPFLHLPQPEGQEAFRFLLFCLFADARKSPFALFSQFRRKNHSPYGETAFQHLDGRSGNGREAIASYLKMKAAMQAALALQKFKGLQAAKKSAPSEPVAAQ